MLRPPKGRPQTWPTKITAPPLAIELYKLIGRLQKSDAFDTCHVYHGAVLHGEPMIKYEGKSTGLPFVIASYIGLPNGPRKCDTPGCCNPFHYLPEGMVGGNLVAGREEKDRTLEIGVEEWADLIDHEADKRRVRMDEITLVMARGWILVEDLSDEQLEAGLIHLQYKGAS